MPSPKTTLNLEAWSDFSPKKRLNDDEYNQLLYKFRSLLNEVKDFQTLHSNCSVTRAALASTTEPPVFGSPIKNVNTSSITSFSQSNNVTNCTVSTSSVINPTNGQHVFLHKRPYLPHQNSVPPIGGSSSTGDALFSQNFRRHQPQQQEGNGTNAQLYNSSYNLSSSSKSSTHNNPAGVSRPEVRQRNQVSNSRMLMSKSSERLDSIVNNNNNSTSSNSHFYAASRNYDLDSFHPKNNSTPNARDNSSTQNDSNIYDAVSPDDLLSTTDLNTTPSVASSIHNLNRLSFPNKARLESSKSSLGLGSSLDNSKSFKLPVSNTKSTPSWSHDNPDKSINSFGSSNILEQDANNSSSSLSLLASQISKNTTNDSNQYSNYVNIDFFLRRSNSPSVDGLEEEATNDDESSDDSDQDTTQMSHSLSSDLICDDALRNVSARELALKFSNKVNANSSASVTPASSGDFLDDQRSSSITNVVQHHTTPNQNPNKPANFTPFNSRDTDSPNHFRQASISSKESNNKSSPPQQTMGLIHEQATSFSTTNSNLYANQADKDGTALVEAHHTMRSFLSDLNLSPVDNVFEDKAQRRIVKESFAVEFCGRRKLRHLFLFNDVIVCAKYQASSKQKFTFDVKWYLNLQGVSILDFNDVSNQVKYDKEAIENQILAIRTNLMLLRGQMQHIKKTKNKQPIKMIKKLKKKRTELEAELVLLLPHLPLVVKHVSGKKYTFFLSSNFDRNQWIESIKFLQSQLPPAKGSTTSPSSSELQAWIQTCRKNLNPSLGTFLLRSNCDDDLLYGDLYINLNCINGVSKSGNYYFCFEVDSYGHFSQKASSAVMHIENPDQALTEEYCFPLDGAHTLRIILYEDLGLNAKPSVIGKAHIELSRAWFLDKKESVEKTVLFSSSCSLKSHFSYSSSELLSMRIPHAKLCPNFGMDITQVCKKEKTNVPLLIQLCVNEVERRGMREVGIYRMSGTSTDIQRLKKAFETNPYVAELLLRDIDINSVTGFLKTYLREMPEGLFSNKLYPKFVAAFNIPQTDNLGRTRKMLDLFHMIPITNQHTIIYLVEHLVKVNKYESNNKMSLTNLATVLGPNILKPPTESSGTSSADPFTAVVIGSMSQAGILYFFLNRKFCNLPLTELDSSEMSRSTGR